MPRLVKVSLWQLTDQELDDLAAAADATDPDRAAELRQVKIWQRDTLCQKVTAMAAVTRVT